MALTTATRGYKGRGRFTLRPLSGGRPFELGNVTELTETIEVDRISRPNMQDCGGGELDVEEIIKSYTFELKADDITPETQAIAFNAMSETFGTLAITGEKHTSFTGIREMFEYIPDPAVAPVVAIDATDAWAAATAYTKGSVIIDTGAVYQVETAGTSGATEPTWPTAHGTVTDGTVVWRHIGATAPLVVDKDYTATATGIRMNDDPENVYFADASTSIPISINYTRNPQVVLQLLATSPIEYELTFEGLNCVDAGNPVPARYFRVKFSPTSGFPRMGGDSFAELSLSGTVLSDSSRTGTGMSKFAKSMMVV